MRNDLTPVEGKGEEMIPERGLPFEDDPIEQMAFDFQDFEETDSPTQELSEVDELPTLDEVDELLESLETYATTPEPEHLLDIEEIRGRELELVTDIHLPSPEFDGEPDTEFATARTPIPLPKADQEAIMLESGAGIIHQEDLDQTSELEPEDLSSTLSKSYREVGNLPLNSFHAGREMLDILITPKTVDALWKRANDLQAEVIENIDDIELAHILLEQIRTARSRLIEKKDNYETAEQELNEVEFRLAFNHRAQEWRGTGYRLMIYEIIWVVAFLVITTFLLWGGENSLAIRDSTLISKSEVFIGMGGIVWGGMGGVVGALHTLWRYITSQKFNPQYNIWYLSQPIQGAFVGALIFILIKLAFSLLAGSTSVEIGSPWPIYLLAFIGGFQQNMLYDMVRRILRLFTPEKNSPQ